MQRYHEEKHIIAKRAAECRQVNGYDYFKPGRYRKTHNGCNKAACGLCHPEKFPKRIPTRKEKQAEYDQQNFD